MGAVSDRRSYSGRIGGESRTKYLQKNKEHIKKKIKEMVADTNIKDITSKRKYAITPPSDEEPSYEYNPESGVRPYAISGNDGYVVGDKYPLEKQGGGKQSGHGEGEDDFSFVLTRQELLDYLFDDMELPNFVKQGIRKINGLKMVRKGYTKEGMPSRLNTKKTMECSLARRIAAKNNSDPDKKVPFIDDVDLRYDRRETEKVTIKHAVMICLLDVSGSMGAFEKDIAKRFMLLVCLFLERHYAAVDLRFVTYCHGAKEVSENEFFYSKETGSTNVLAGANKVSEIISSYDLNQTNIYVVHASDGDIDDSYAPVEAVVRELTGILKKVQYYAYIEISEFARNSDYMIALSVTKLLTIFAAMAVFHHNLGTAFVMQPKDVYSALKELFKRGPRG